MTKIDLDAREGGFPVWCTVTDAATGELKGYIHHTTHQQVSVNEADVVHRHRRLGDVQHNMAVHSVVHNS